jgi:hypothetical protein
VTTADPFEGKPRTLDGSMVVNGCNGIPGTGGNEPASGSDEGGNGELVDFDNEDDPPGKK